MREPLKDFLHYTINSQVDTMKPLSIDEEDDFDEDEDSEDDDWEEEDD